MSEVKTQFASGGCQCGAVRYVFHAPPRYSHVCHCRMCQRATGGLFAALVGVPKPDFAWTKGEPGVFASSNVASRAFCRDCGTPLSFSYNQPDAHFYVTIGSLDDPEAVPIGRQFGLESRLSWVRFCDDVEGEATGTDPKAADFLARMINNQG